MGALPQIEAVLFDMGGTLVDFPIPSWPVLAARCVSGAVSGLVLGDEGPFPPAASVPRSQDAPSRRHGARPDAPLVHRVSMAIRRMVRNVSGHTLPTMGEMCARPLLAKGSLIAEARETLATLRSRGYRLGLVSNTPWGTPEYLWRGQLERFDLDAFFEVIHFSSDVGFRKPDPRIFRLTLEGLRVRPQAALFVGDEPEADIVGARGAGLASAWINRPDGPRRTPPDPPADVTLDRIDGLLAHLPAS